jgi:predicted RNA-binding Zn ribbon-like protein
MVVKVRPSVKRTPTNAMLEFRFVSGDKALDFLATFADRHRGGVERLRQPPDLDRWLMAAGLGLASRASETDLESARALRESINRLARAAMQQETVRIADVEEVNARARGCPLTPQLDSDYQRSWAAPATLEGALTIIAREAIALLSSSDAKLLRECAASPACSLLYLDHSRGRRRRWCEMKRCGSRVKMAGHRTRRRIVGEPPNTGERPIAR